MARADVADTSKRNGHIRFPEDVATEEPRASLLSRLVRELGAQAQRAIPKADLDERDPDFIRERLPLMWLIASIWYRGEVRGLGNIPEEGAVLTLLNDTHHLRGLKDAG